MRPSRKTNEVPPGNCTWTRKLRFTQKFIASYCRIPGQRTSLGRRRPNSSDGDTWAIGDLDEAHRREQNETEIRPCDSFIEYMQRYLFQKVIRIFQKCISSNFDFYCDINIFMLLVIYLFNIIYDNPKHSTTIIIYCSNNVIKYFWFNFLTINWY